MTPSILRDGSQGPSNGLNGYPYHQSGSHNHLLDQSPDKLEPIAVVGFSLRFPQDATSPETFWRMLTEGRCAMTEFPKDRMNVDAFYHPDSNRYDSIPLRGGHFMQGDIGAFDAPFFSISPAEAAGMDPQQRGLLETAYRALEDANIPLEKVVGSRTSVHTGCFTDDYKLLFFKDPQLSSQYAVTGLAVNMLANRLSWFFDLSGSSVNLDTACSSSMVALDLACKELRSGDATMGLVAGCNLICGPDITSALANMSFLSQDSQCYSFDQRANGYSRGEGYGVIVVKLLSKAIEDGDTIRAVIRSTHSNQDGHTPGITQPSQDAQECLIRDTYEKAGLDMRATRYFEAHGTGTALGDPIEANAVGAAFRRQQDQCEPLFIGSVKANIGHLEGASGIAGIIKTIMVLENAVIPANVNLNNLNSKIDADYLKLKFPTKNVPWPSSGLRRASINSFGFGGTNSHVVLDDAYNYLRLRNIDGNHCTRAKPPSTTDLVDSNGVRITSAQDCEVQSTSGNLRQSQRPRLLVWSAADEGGLKRLAEAYSHHFVSLCLPKNEADTYLERLEYTLSLHRTALPWKSFSTIHNLSQLQIPDIGMSKPVRATVRPKVAFIFTGQGAQWYAMGRELLVYFPFRHSLEKAGSHLKGLGCTWSLLDELLKEKSESNVHKAHISQPLCTALQLALVDLLQSFGVRPSIVIGHSSGEIAAAYCAGLSWQSALALAYYKGDLAATLASNSQLSGGMISVELSEAQIEPYFLVLKQLYGRCRVSIGCVNSQKNTTVSGDAPQIDTLKILLDVDGVFCRKLNVEVAYHSPHMNEIACDYKKRIACLKRRVPFEKTCVMISSVTGGKASLDDICSSEYWVNNMVLPVRFLDAIVQIRGHSGKRQRKKLDGSHRYSQTINDVLEIGPHSALQGPFRDALASAPDMGKVSYRSMLIRNVSALDTALEVVGYMHCSGYEINLAALNQASDGHTAVKKPLVNLPAYPFNHAQTYWHEGRISKHYRFRGQPSHDLLGTSVSDWNASEPRWTKFIKISELPWVQDHRINGSLLYPAAGMLVMAIEAVYQLRDHIRHVTGYRIRNARFDRSLIISTSPEGTETQMLLRSLKEDSNKDSAMFEFRLYSYEGATDGWTKHCDGRIQILYEVGRTEVDNGKEAWKEGLRLNQAYENSSGSCGNDIDSESTYRRLQQSGLEYGPSFQRLDKLCIISDGIAKGEVTGIPHSSDSALESAQPYVIHPAVLDGILQMTFPALFGTKDTIAVPTLVPTRVQKLWISSAGLARADSVKVHAKSASKGYRAVESSIFALDKLGGGLRVLLEGVEMTAVASQKLSAPTAAADTNRLCYNVHWRPDVDLLDAHQLLAYCESARPEREEPLAFYNDLDALIRHFISETLKVVDKLELEGLAPHLQRYIAWMKILTDEASAKSEVDGAHDSALDVQDKDDPLTLCDRVENSKEGKIFVTVGRSLLNIVKGEIDTLDLLFKEGLARDYYHEVNTNVICFATFSRYLDAIAHRNPEMRILEVGAGTGGTTANVLNTLMLQGDDGIGTSRFSHYDYTDLSAAFFEQAREKFTENNHRMTFRPLNIEEDALGQGFDPSSYDLVIASSVLHATKNLERTLRNLRKLLKPGGRLMLLEPTRPKVLRTGFVFGLLPGWWLGTEAHRQMSPCISERDWNTVLACSGFSGTDVVLRDYRDETCHEFSIMVSTALPSKDTSIQIPDMTIVMRNDGHEGQIIANTLRESLQAMGTLKCQVLSISEVVVSAELLRHSFCVFLPELKDPLLRKLDNELFNGLKQIFRFAENLLWVTGGGGKFDSSPDFNVVDGLARVLRTEYKDIRLITLALEIANSTPKQTVESIARVIKVAVNKTNEKVYESEYREMDGVLHINRIIEDSPLDHKVAIDCQSEHSAVRKFGECPPLSLRIASPGLLDSIQFLEDPVFPRPLAPNEVEVKVEAAGVNFMDCLVALGRINQTEIGGECAGTVSRVGEQSDFQLGDRVAVCSLDTFRTYARSTSECVVKIPTGVSFAAAAAIPINFATAYYALVEVARLERRQSVLIHSGAGGTGQASIQIALYYGAEVYTTVGSDDKKQLVMSYGVPEDHILYSRDTSFAEGIKRLTHGRGVDITLNSLAGESLVASWECTAPFGRFIEIGKRDIQSHGSLPMFPFAKNVSFSAVDLVNVIQERPSIISKCLKKVMDLIGDGKLHAARPLHVYGVAELEGAFRYMQSGKNTGKIVIEMRKDDEVFTVLERKPKYFFDEAATYLIAGGLGGLGRSIGRWLVSRGARNLVLLSRFGPRSEAARTFLDDMKKTGAKVYSPACDVADAASLASVIDHCNGTMPKIRGCIQASMLLKDSLFENMTFDDWSASVDPKIRGSWNLHTFLPKGMDFFILLSSIIGILGSGGQANYAAGNSYQDSLARYRVSLGERAASLDLGVMLEEGFVAENEPLMKRMQAYGYYKPLGQNELFALLDHYCDPAQGIPTFLKSQSVLGIETPGRIRARGVHEADWMSRPLFSHLRQIGDETGAGSAPGSGQSVDFKSVIVKAASVAAAGAVVTQALTQKLAKTLSVKQEDIDVSKPMHVYGVDSLVAVELRNWFAQAMGADIAVFAIMGGATFTAVGMLVAEKSRYRKS